MAALSVTLTTLLVIFTLRTMTESAKQKFDHHAEEITGQINARLSIYESLLRGGAGFFAGSDYVSRAEWETYVEALNIDERWPGIQGVGYSAKVLARDKKDHLLKMRDEGFAGYQIKPEGDRELHGVVVYLEPLNWRNQKAIGYDMYSNPARRSAMDHARDTGEGSISGKVTLVQEAQKDVQAGFLMYFPVYKGGKKAENVEERRQALRGWVYAPFRARDFMRGLVGADQAGIGLEVYDGMDMAEESLMFKTANIPGSDLSKSSNNYDVIKRLKFKDHDWSFRFTASKRSLAPELEGQFRLLLGMAVTINLLIIYLIYSIQGVRRRAERIAEGMTSELKARTRDLEKNRRILSMINDAMERSVIVAMTDSKGKITHVNQRFCDISQYSPEELLGQDHRIVNSGLHPKEFWKDFWATINTGRSWRGEVRNRAKDGSYYWVDTSVVPILGVDGRPEQFMAFRFLITDRKRAEEALQKLSSFQENVLKNAGSSVIATTEEGVITHFNPAAEKMLGYSAAEMIGLQTPKIFHDKDEVVRRAEEFGGELGERIEPGFEVFVAKARRNLPNIHDWTYIRKDGSRISVLLTVTALRDLEDKIFGFVGIATDITERKRMEEKIAEAIAVKGEFISMVSHELRTPLTVIKEGIGLVADGTLGTLNADQSDYLNLAQRNTDRLARLINDVLDYQKLDAGQMIMKTAQHDLNEVIRENLPTFASLAAQRGLMVKTELAHEILPLSFDKDKIVQVLMNFVGNAIKFTETGHVTIRTTYEGNAVHVAVVDNGIGIKEEDQHKLFTSFSQIHNDGIHKTGGTGLGLAISKRIIEMHRGRIGVTSAWGHGATFYFTLPIVERRR